jgi:membrane associated rhomboid family serine protease
MQKEVMSKFKYPMILLAMMWLVYIVNNLIFNHPLDHFALYPRQFSHLPGIFITPFLHANFYHILNNSIMFLILSTIICVYNEDIYLYVVGFVMVSSGLAMWLFSSTSVVGASGLVFGLFGAVFGIAFYCRKVFFIIAAALLAYMYGYSMTLGLVPQDGISFIGHASGLVMGFISGSAVNHLFFKKSTTSLA